MEPFLHLVDHNGTVASAVDLDPTRIQMNVFADHPPIVLAMSGSNVLWWVCVRRCQIVTSLTRVGDPHPSEASTIHLNLTFNTLCCPMRFWIHLGPMNI